jgi:hypothetical protein
VPLVRDAVSGTLVTLSNFLVNIHRHARPKELAPKVGEHPVGAGLPRNRWIMGSVEESRNERVRHHDLVGPINRGDTNEQALIVEVKERTTASCGRLPANAIWVQCLGFAKFLHLDVGRERRGLASDEGVVGCEIGREWAPRFTTEQSSASVVV